MTKLILQTANAISILTLLITLGKQMQFERRTLYQIVFERDLSNIRAMTPNTTTTTKGVQRKTLSEISAAVLTPAAPLCSTAQSEYQAKNWCEMSFQGRHNLKPIFAIIRFHLPDASVMVDIGGNKGLVSARWLELWRPELNITAKVYHSTVVRSHMVKHGENRAAGCGVTNMCEPPDLEERRSLDYYSPSLITKDDFHVYSFEPSPPLYNMHKEYLKNNMTSRRIVDTWSWYRLAVSDVIGKLHFQAKWDEGSQIDAESKEEPNTNGVTLDYLAYGVAAENTVPNKFVTEEAPPLLFQDTPVIDVIKIDAETVDAKVVAGASRLLKEGRIRVIMWETPNTFPITFPAWDNLSVTSFGELVDAMDVHAGMSCYFPGYPLHIKLTNCYEATLSSPGRCTKSCPHRRCGPDFANAMCVSRKLAPSLYRTLEAKSVAYAIHINQ